MSIVEQKDNELSQIHKELVIRDQNSHRLQEEVAVKSDEIISLKGIIARLEN